MENNTRYVVRSEDLHNGARALADRTIDMARLLVQGSVADMGIIPGGRKGNQLDVHAQI